MKDYKSCTVVMTTYSNNDFTNASVWALRRFYPDIKIIFADGHPTIPFSAGYQMWENDDEGKVDNSRLVWLPGACTEDCRNAAMALVDTEYGLLMDNDVKVIASDAIPLCLEVFEKHLKAAATGWYGLVVTDWYRHKAYVGTEFFDHINLDATQATFSLHRTDVYRAVGGMPKQPFWDGCPPDILEGYHPAYMGDFTICRRYAEAGFEIISPRKTLPILHWTQAIAWQKDKEMDSIAKWVQDNATHTRINPLNDWRYDER